MASNVMTEIADLDEWVEYSYREELTDGLAVLPPTEQAVDCLMASSSVGDEALGPIPPRMGMATSEAIAANAAMAGCLPQYMPVVEAAIRAMLDERFNLHGVQCTAHIVQPLTIVSGPIVEEFGFNNKAGYFGGGSRANATIGRALRLVLLNTGGNTTGTPDRSSSAHPGRYTFCIAEDLDDSPWTEPLHVRRGIGTADDSAVTVIAVEAPQYVSYGASCPPVQNLSNIADTLSSLAHNNAYTQGELLVGLSATVSRGLKEAAWTERDVKEYLFRHAGNRVGDLWRSPYFHKVRESIYAQWPDYIDVDDPQCFAPVVRDPDGFVLISAGGEAGSVVCTGWGTNGGYSCTKLIVSPSHR